MAFNKDDSDALYDNQILPVLRNNGIKPVIINRRQSNQDLNIQIIQQLLRCDFSITDLTYARQSVYYEAGFAERLVPVIYTVRRDHLRDGQPDNLRVHFDLQMKPLIIWDDPDDATFARRLERRLNATVLREWRRKQQRQEKLAASEEEFDSLSQGGKLALLRRRTISRLKYRGFRAWLGPYHPRRTYTYEQIHAGTVNDVRSFTSDAQSLHLVTVNAFPSATKTVLRTLREKYSPRRFSRIVDKEMIETTEAIRADHFVLSVRDVPAARIEDVLTYHRPTQTRRLYSTTQLYRRLGSDPESRRIPLASNWHFLSKVKSGLELRELLSDHLGELFEAEAA